MTNPTDPTTLTSSPRPVAYWLLAVCALIFAMVVLGGVTRLTGSGLSMVEWDPIMGMLPPTSEAGWEIAFEKYRQYPEYQKKNLHMDLAGFKQIFWFEYAHRMLGRGIGLAFLLPFLYFLARGRLRRPFVPKLVIMFVLGGLQGLLGWFMVKSGLIDDPHVSQYRLTAHLAAAFIIYAYILWTALGLLFPGGRGGTPDGIRRGALAVTVLVAVTVLSGGFVAGMKAGFAYNTFPLMGGQWIPPGYLALSPVWLNAFENMAAVQFHHRVLAITTLAVVLALWLAARGRVPVARARTGLHLLALMALVQVALGISTLLLHVPVAVASAHQAGALVLLTIALFVNHTLARPRVGSS